MAKSTSAPAIPGSGTKPQNPYTNVPKATGYSGSASTTNSNAPVLTNPADDPFFTIRDRTKGELNNIKAKYKEFSSLAKTVDTKTSSEFKEVRRDLTKLVRIGERSVKDLVEAVENVELNRFKYPAIKDSDLTGRKKTIEGNHSLTYLLFHSHTHSRTHSLTYVLTHSLTHSQICKILCVK